MADLTVFIFVLIASVYDIRTGRIPNLLILSGCLAGLLLSAAGISISLSASLKGMLLPLLFPGVLFAFGIMGAGDIKLMCMIGLYTGAGSVFRIICLAFAAAAVQSVFLLKDPERRMGVFGGFHRLMLFFAPTGGAWRGERYLEQAPAKCKIRFSPAVLVGLVLQILFYD